jgi:tRNA-dihydrouridine synthase
LESPEKVADFLKSWSLSELGKISIKLRLGVNKNCSNTLIPLLHSFPTIDEIILHPRRAIDYYHGPINQKAFFPWKKKFGDRMVWSGEVWNTDQALELLKTLGSDTALMLGRGLVGDPGLAMKIRGQQPEADRYRHFFNELINVSSEGRLKEFSRLWEKQMHPDRAFWETFRRTRDRAQLLTMLERFKKLL